MLAILESLDDQVPPEVAFANCVVNPWHSVVDPVIPATTGRGLAVTVVVADIAEHPEALVTVT